MEEAIERFLTDWGVQGAVIVVLGYYIWRLEINRGEDRKECDVKFQKLQDDHRQERTEWRQDIFQQNKQVLSVLNELKGIIKTIK